MVNIDITDERLAAYGLSTVQVLNQLNSQNMVFDAGSMAAGHERIRIDQSSSFQSLQDIQNFTLKGG